MKIIAQIQKTTGRMSTMDGFNQSQDNCSSFMEDLNSAKPHDLKPERINPMEII